MITSIFDHLFLRRFLQKSFFFEFFFHFFVRYFFYVFDRQLAISKHTTIMKNVIIFFIIKALNCVYRKFRRDDDNKNNLTKHVRRRNLTKLFVREKNDVWFLNENIKCVFKFRLFFFVMFFKIWSMFCVFLTNSYNSHFEFNVNVFCNFNDIFFFKFSINKVISNILTSLIRR